MGKSCLFYALTLCFVAGCTDKINTHGWVGDFATFKKIQQGKITKTEIEKKLGRAPLVSVFSEKRYGADILYYIRRQTIEKTSLFYPQAIYYEGRELRFDPRGRLTQKTLISEADCVKVVPSVRQTAYYGDVPSIWSIFVRNLGRTGVETGA